MPAAESPFGDTKKVADTAQKANQARKLFQRIALVIKGASGPGGWLLAGAQLATPLIKKFQALKRKIALGIGATILALLYWLWIKFLGLLAGLAFGAITGLPLLLIPGAGPFLYGGWVAYWGYKGFTDPIGTIHLATHPWEAITKPAAWLRDRFLDFTSGPKEGATYVTSGVGHAASSAFGAVGSFVTGVTSTLWNAGTAAAANAWGFFTNVGGAVLQGFTASGGAIASNLTTVAVGGATATITGGVVLTTVMTNSAFFTPEGDIEGLGPAQPPGTNEFFTISKTASPASLSAPNSSSVTFTIILTAKEQAITAVGFVDNFRYEYNGSETQLNAPGMQCPTLPIAPGGTCQVQFSFNPFLLPNNSLLVNTVLASVTLADGRTVTDSSSTSVPIGAPATGCPSGWPITGHVSQGPEGGTSHAAGTLTPTDPGYEAIDIGTGTDMDRPVYATVSGTIDIRQSREIGVDERFAIIPDNCPGLNVVVYMHMSDIVPNEGEHVSARQQIGLSGAYRSSGGTLAPHIHYQFNESGDRSFKIEPPYIPENVPRTCNGDCNITTTAP